MNAYVKCAIWGTNAKSFNVGQGDYSCFNSPRAGGKYKISGSASASIAAMPPSEKARVTTWLVDQRRAGNELPFILSAALEVAKTARPLTVIERRDRLIFVVHELAPQLGQFVKYDTATQEFLMSNTESVDFAEVEKLVEFGVNQLLLDPYKVSLTLKGYAWLEEQSASRSNSKQAFVAMWFDKEVAELYSQGIEPAVIASGYRPMRIDKKEHNNKIDDEIIAEIRRSRFVIADFTCGLVKTDEIQTAIPRGGVYYEAGLAQGLGIPVIWMCREDHIKHVHFDTRQFNHITWTTPNELQGKLINRIGAVIGDGPLKAEPK